MSLLLDPRLFNYVIITLYALASLRWAYNGSWADAFYWSGALWITIVVTFWYKH